MANPVRSRMTIDEYFELEAASAVRHEYVDDASRRPLEEVLRVREKAGFVYG